MSSGLTLKCGLPYYPAREKELSRTQVLPAASDMLGGEGVAAGRPMGDLPKAAPREPEPARVLSTLAVRALACRFGHLLLGAFSRCVF